MGGLPNSKCTTLHLLHLCHHHESTQTFHVSCSPNSLSNATREDVPAVSCTNTFRNPCSQKKSAMKSKRPCCEAEVRTRKSGLHTVCQSASKKTICILHAMKLMKSSVYCCNLTYIDRALAHSFAPRMLEQM